MDIKLVVFLSVMFLTVASAACGVALSIAIQTPPDLIKEIIKSMMWLSTLGAGAVIGSLPSLLTSQS